MGTTATARDFAGLTTLVSAAQTRAGTGTLVSDLDALEFRVRPRQGKADFFLMDYLTYGLYLKALRIAGCTPELMADPLAGGARVAHNGMPIYRSHHRHGAGVVRPPPPGAAPGREPEREPESPRRGERVGPAPAREDGKPWQAQRAAGTADRACP